jgi:hypothetical protein
VRKRERDFITGLSGWDDPNAYTEASSARKSALRHDHLRLHRLLFQRPELRADMGEVDCQREERIGNVAQRPPKSEKQQGKCGSNFDDVEGKPN